MPLIGRRRPLLRAVAVGAIAHRANQRESAQEQRIAELETSQAAPTGPTLVDQLKELAVLRDQGVLTEEEFAAQKSKLLG